MFRARTRLFACQYHKAIWACSEIYCGFLRFFTEIFADKFAQNSNPIETGTSTDGYVLWVGMLHRKNLLKQWLVNSFSIVGLTLQEFHWVGSRSVESGGGTPGARGQRFGNIPPRGFKFRMAARGSMPADKIPRHIAEILLTPPRGTWFHIVKSSFI